jgi:hypothetical protein
MFFWTSHVFFVDRWCNWLVNRMIYAICSSVMCTSSWSNISSYSSFLDLLVCWLVVLVFFSSPWRPRGKRSVRSIFPCGSTLSRPRLVKEQLLSHQVLPRSFLSLMYPTSFVITMLSCMMKKCFAQKFLEFDQLHDEKMCTFCLLKCAFHFSVSSWSSRFVEWIGVESCSMLRALDTKLNCSQCLKSVVMMWVGDIGNSVKYLVSYIKLFCSSDRQKSSPLE